MSGQPYRKATDIDKFRNQYMEALDLQAGINALNYEANMNFLQTGVLPPVSTMKDPRSVEDKLRDFEMLKQDISATIATVSSKQFGSLVVQTILNSPLNVDNKLLVYTAQRIDDIIKQLSKIYKYGIRGDVNDAQQFVRFIEKMFTDTSAMTASTKEFMNRYSERSMLGSQYDQTRTKLTEIGARLRNIQTTLTDYKDGIDRRYEGTERLSNSLNTLVKLTKQTTDYIRKLLDSTPQNIEVVKVLEQYILSEMVDEGDRESFRALLEFINTGLPNVSSLTAMMERFNKHIINVTRGLELIIREPINSDISRLSSVGSVIGSINESLEYGMSMASILQPLGSDYSIDTIKALYDRLKPIVNRGSMNMGLRIAPEILERDPAVGVFGGDEMEQEMEPIVEIPEQPEPQQQAPEPAPGVFGKIRRFLSPRPKQKPSQPPANAGPSGSGMRKSRGRGRPRTRK